MRRKKQTLLSIIILFLIIATIITFIQPFKYTSAAKLLVVQQFPPGFDPYSASKSNEYLSSVLAQVVSSNSFYGEVLNAGFNIKRDFFGKDVNEQMKLWHKTVSAAAVADSGIINITVKHQDQYQADQLIRAINYTLQTKNNLYHGIGEHVLVKIIDQPLVSAKPNSPNIMLNLLIGFLAGLAAALVYIYLFPDASYNLKLFSGQDGNHTDGEKENKYSRDEIYQGEPLSVEHEAGYNKSYYAKLARAEKQPNSHNSALAGAQSDDLSYEDIANNGSMRNLMRSAKAES